MFPEYDQSKLGNVASGDETRIDYFEVIRKKSNKIRSIRKCKRPIIAKCTLSSKMFCR